MFLWRGQHQSTVINKKQNSNTRLQALDTYLGRKVHDSINLLLVENMPD